MAVHRPVARQVLQALQQTFEGGFYCDRVLERVFKNNRQLGSRDRRFIAEATYDIVRWWRLLWYAIGKTELAEHAQNKSFQESDLWHLIGAWLLRQGQELPAWPEFEGFDASKVRERLNSPERSLAIAESVPDWLYEIGARELGERWPQVLHALNQQAPVTLRANRLKTSPKDLQAMLRKEGIETRLMPSLLDGLILGERRNIFTSPLFKDGFFEVQDGASQQVAPLLQPQPGERIVDACAGAGGKTLHLAALMKNKGKIVALDVVEKKLEELRKRSTRNGVDIIETKLIDSAKTIKRLEKSADGVLLDVPCSGLGVLRRNPDAKWKLMPEELDRLKSLQAEILASYSTMAKPGGRMVYATCSVLPSENGLQVKAFLESEAGTGWELVSEKSFWPGEDESDGFYAAVLHRK